ncbi:MAG TPA: acyl-CoA dehydrogenase family protein [Pirellulales bacterium]|jgi:alkylation response protein AidB-like acyl-CoA dehydrogenase|nr:acyl-CoA dehydrogenase family protein [Pirellulales bacterium]
MAATNREKQIAEAEELFGDRLAEVGFAKGLYFGRFLNRKLLSYPDFSSDYDTARRVEGLRQFCQERIDPVAIDREAMIPQDVVDGLGQLGMLGACLPTSCGGLGLSQTAYCRLLEVLGGHCASTALFVNAHHSIGPRAVVLFGTPDQQAKWLPNLASGRWISAFALTEPQAGSDAANVQTTATPTPDGRGYVLNGEKRWITNGSLAQVLTVMARTPVPNSTETKITAFIVTPDMPGFEVTEARMPKCGVRGTATSRLAFHDMFVPRENVLGQLGKGLKVALTVLDFGRTTFGATCTGAAKICAERAAKHAATRIQFGQPIGQFELVKEKLAYMNAGIFATEAATYLTAALIDSGHDDYMLETAMLKVFATDTLWRIVNDTIQIFGGKAYFTDEPYERMMRDARINMIGEGANDVLRAFVALVGMRDVGLELQSVLTAFKRPLKNFGKLSDFVGRRMESLFRPPEVSVSHAELEPDARRLGKLIAQFGANVERLLRTYREGIVDREYQLGRIGESAIELYVSACVLKRLDTTFGQADHGGASAHDGEAKTRSDLIIARHYLHTAERRIRGHLTALWDNDDRSTTQAANLLLP